MATVLYVLVGVQMVVVGVLVVGVLHLRSRVCELEDAVREHSWQLGRLNGMFPIDGPGRGKKIARG